MDETKVWPVVVVIFLNVAYMLALAAAGAIGSK